MSSRTLIEVADLRIHFDTEEGVARAVDGVSFDIRAGETLALVGESGSGKSVTSLALMSLVPSPPARISGSVRYGGRDLLQLPRHELHRIRGNDIAMIFQEPMSSLNPVLTVGEQIIEAVRLHQGCRRHEARARVVTMLERVGLADATRLADAYPFQLSGGMRQRVMIAMALSCGPKLLIADEPTTALDVTTQAQILDLLSELRAEFDTAILFITHDLGVVAQIAQRVLVMYAGRLVEEAPVVDLYKRPLMPYTAALMGSIPHLATGGNGTPPRLAAIPGTVPDPLALPPGCTFHPRCMHVVPACRAEVPAMGPADTDRRARCLRWQELDLANRAPSGATAPAPEAATSATARGDDLVSTEELTVGFAIRRAWLQRRPAMVAAVREVDLSIRRGEVLGLVGESGSGKTTLGRALLRLVEPANGAIRFGETDLTALSGARLKPFRRHMQMVFQDPYGSLNTRMTVGDILAEPFTIHGLPAGPERIAALLMRVGLSPAHAGRFPHEFSGGQRQRIGIARSLAVEPEFLVADEPVSALDVSVQAQILNLIRDLKDELGLTVLFIAHDLGVVRYVADRVAVMYLGRIVEIGPAGEIYANPVHPYTEALLAAVPVPDPRRASPQRIVRGEAPSPANPPSGCAFRTRCPIAAAECAQVVPPLKETSPGHLKACIRR